MENRDELVKYTIPQLLRWRVTQSADKVALREKDFGRWNIYTWRTYYEFVRKSGLGLAELGLEKGDRIALIGDNIPELLFVAVGAQALGAISAGLYQSSLPEEISGILNYLGVSIVFCDDQEQVDKLIEIRTAIPQVKKVIYEDPRGMRSYRSDDWFMPIEALYDLGEKVHAEAPDRFENLLDQGSPDDVCHLCLTSGTTGLPKGAEMMHRNYINMGLQITKVDPLAETDEYLSFLPFAWIGEQQFGVYWPLYRAFAVNFPEKVETVQENIREIGPHILLAPPRIWEKI